MAVSGKKTRVMVTFSNEVLEKLDAYCERVGITKSAFISYTVATALDTREQLMSNVSEEMASAINGDMKSE